MNIKESNFNNKKDVKILLTGVFGPFARNDAYGSRKANPMELYHNQVTRVQGPFSLRMFHRTFGLLMIEANIDAPCTVLEFPTLDRFIKEIKSKKYDIIGISSIVPNTLKVKKMCGEIRRYAPDATIVVGGHIANRDDLKSVIDTDFICRGDGIRWFRNFLGQDIDAPIKHPAVISGFSTRIMGLTVIGGKPAATLIPSVGCPMGCNFCSTSTLFGGKGNSVIFYKTGQEMFSVLCQLEKKLKVDSFFIMDENFLLRKKRALSLLELMEKNNKSWELFVFSSARVIESYTIDQLVRLGISWVWMGLEGENSRYSKLHGVDTKSLVKRLQSHGIRVLGSTIIGFEDHTPENIDRVIDYSVSHDTDFHQFMLYLPLPGTPLYKEYREKNLLLSEDECPSAVAHGQEKHRGDPGDREQGIEHRRGKRKAIQDHDDQGQIQGHRQVLEGGDRDHRGAHRIGELPPLSEDFRDHAGGADIGDPAEQHGLQGAPAEQQPRDQAGGEVEDQVQAPGGQPRAQIRNQLLAGIVQAQHEEQ